MTEKKPEAPPAADSLETPLEPAGLPAPPFAARPAVSLPPRLGADPKLRQQLLRRVVDENVAGQQGLPSPAAAPPARSGSPLPGGRALTVALAVALPLAAALLAWGLWPAGDPPPAAAQAAVESAAGPADRASSPLVTTDLKPIGAEVLGLGVHRILLDPGHGGSDTGTTGGGLAEKDLTLDISLRVRQHLEEAGFEVHMTRSSDLALTLRERSEMANLLGAHLFVSVHINYLPGSRSARGVETYFVGHTDDPELLELARRENANSGYDMASNNRLLEKLYTDARQQNSRSFATRVQQMLFSSLKPANPELLDRGVKQAPFVVLVGTTMPAILAEVACLSSTQDLELLARPLYRESIAEALARGIRRYADDMNPSQEKGS